jgi:hypothetical protein
MLIILPSAALIRRSRTVHNTVSRARSYKKIKNLDPQCNFHVYCSNVAFPVIFAILYLLLKTVLLICLKNCEWSILSAWKIVNDWLCLSFSVTRTNIVTSATLCYSLLWCFRHTSTVIHNSHCFCYLIPITNIYTNNNTVYIWLTDNYTVILTDNNAALFYSFLESLWYAGMTKLHGTVHNC